MSKSFLTYDDLIRKLIGDRQIKMADPAYAKTKNRITVFSFLSIN